METKNISAQLQSPISISTERQSQFSECLDYIAGSTLRGSLAQRYLDIYGKDALFDEIFLQETCCFSDLLPATSISQNSQYLPMTSLSCKRVPGFSGHGVVDSLWFRAAQQLLQNHSKPLDVNVLTRLSICPYNKCGQDMKTWLGYWNNNVRAPEYIEVLRTETLHTGIDRKTGTVAEKILYAIQAIEPWFPDNTSGTTPGHTVPPVFFNGHLRLSETAWPRIEEMIKRSPAFFLGRGRTRGQGEVKLKLSSESYVDDADWDGWSLACREALQQVTGDQLDGSYFSVGLLSDTIIVDSFLRYTGQLDLQLDRVELISSVLKRGVAPGWNQVHSLPKEYEITAIRGSVFLYHYPGRLSEIKEQLVNLQANGIGLRRNEGFGQIIISNPFHKLFCINTEEANG